MATEIVIDIRKDVPAFEKYLRKRVSLHLAKNAKAKDSEPVKIILFGFEFGQSNWVALFFDTRDDADVDGEWTLMGIEKAMLQRPKWPIWHKLPDGAQVHFINLDGKKINVMSNPDKLICKVVGDALKQVLLDAKKSGEFKRLFKDKKCEIVVENMEGFYGWPAYSKRGKENLV